MADSGTGGRWNTPGVPHKGWSCGGVDDLGDASGSCDMCGNTGVRYVHTMSHEEHDDLDVGCICASHMEGDSDAPRQREKRLKGKAGARARWPTRTWIPDLTPPHYDDVHLKFRGLYLRGRRRRDGKGYVASIDAKDGTITHPTVEAAKLALFEPAWLRLEKVGKV